MRTALSTLELIRPRSLDDALATLARANGGERLIPLAGGTDLYVALNAGTHTGRRFIDVWGLRELRGIRAAADGVTIGALTTFRDVREHPVLRRRFPSLVAAAAEVGAWQIQNRATLAGNIANASPAGDSLPVLLAHDAVIRVRSAKATREIPFEHLYRGYRDVAIEPDELIVSVFLPFAPPGAVPFFRKVGTRRAQSISKVVFAGLLRLAKRGGADHVRLAWGSVAPVTMRARAAEAALAAGAPSAERLAAARAALERDVAPIDDIRSDRAYRLEVAGNVLAQFLRIADRRYARAGR